MVRWKLYTTRLFIIWNAHDWGGERLKVRGGSRLQRKLLKLRTKTSFACTKGYEMTKLPKAIQN